MIADKIKNARTIKKLTREQVAEDLNVSRQTISIEGRMEASYPSSTALLVLSVMPTLIFELKRRMKKGFVRKILIFVTASFSLFMVIGRTVAGVHWLTDIVGAILLSTGSYLIYKAIVLMHDKR